MSHLRATVVVPTLARDRSLLACLASLDAQTLAGTEVIVVDNSGCGAIHSLGAARHRFRLIENRANAGFGEAINQAIALSSAPYLAVLNDDAVAHPRFLEALVDALEANPQAGMAAPRILLGDSNRLDSAAMLVARDGSSKQRGHQQPAASFDTPEEALLPSGCAALYRRRMLDEIGTFAPGFFLYCEDTDLGLRARLAGWHCLYVPSSEVRHAYSQSAGSASLLKAWYVERNRLRLVLRCFPLSWVFASPFCSLWRYLCHLGAIGKGQGKAAEVAHSAGALSMAAIVLKAHLDLLRHLPALLRQRRAIFQLRRLSLPDYKALLRRHSISLREVASL